jgi:hypothetical protein
MTLQNLQRSVSDLALEIGRIDHHLAEIASLIALPPDFAEMNEDRIPKDGAANLWGTIEYVRQDLLSDAIAYLHKAAQQTDADLRDEFVRLRDH